MEIRVFANKESLGAASGGMAAEAVRQAIRGRGAANVILATGASQFETLAHLVRAEGVDWSKVVLFHLDEYVGMPATHAASFRKYLRERFVEKVGPLAAVHWVEGDRPDPAAECRRLGKIIAAHPIDVALVGIGENGHLAFNDPPADFETEQAYLVVDLDEACRRQQSGEGWFASLADVPRRAISMSIRQIMKSRRIICSVPDRRKAEAVKGAVEGPMTNQCPSSILREHPDCTLLVDEASASLLSDRPETVG